MSLRRLLAHDPLAHAERLTGRSYKDDPATMSLGFLGALLHNEGKREALRVSGDTFYSMPTADYLAVVERVGFATVHEETFEGTDCPERFLILFHEPFGILLHVETYNGDRINSGKFYYNWRPTTEARENLFRYTSSGSFGRIAPDVWVGDHDAREALKFHVEELASHGEFVSPWVDRPWLYPLNYREWKELPKDHKQSTAAMKRIAARRLAALPGRVRAAIGEQTTD